MGGGGEGTEARSGQQHNEQLCIQELIFPFMATDHSEAPFWLHEVNIYDLRF